MVKRKTKKEKMRLSIITFVFLGLVVWLGYSLYGNFSKISNKNKELALYTQEYNDLLEENKEKEGELVKMQDPDYIAKYAKEKYMYSSGEEIIIRID